MVYKRVASFLLSFLVLISVIDFLNLDYELKAYTEEKDYEPPFLNSETGKYEISKPEQLLYLCDGWKNDAPSDGHYILTTDIDLQGYEIKSPIAFKKSDPFIGTFDGDHHAIKNFKINYTGKACGLFAYAGTASNIAYIQNLAMVNVDISSSTSVAAFAGHFVGVIKNCISTGKIEVRNETNSYAGAGIVADTKSPDREDLATKIVDCYADINIIGPYDVAGIVSIQRGGQVERCFTTGTIEAKGENGRVGGITSSFNAATSVKNNVSIMQSIKGKIKTDKIVGQLDDEPGQDIRDNFAWEGTDLQGNETTDHPSHKIYENLTSEELSKKSIYESLNWDFNETWDWLGDEVNGRPVLKGYSNDIYSNYLKAPDMTVKSPQICGELPEFVNLNQKKAVNVKAILPDNENVSKVSMYYGYSKDSMSNNIKLALKEDGLYTGKLPTDKAGNLYYYVELETNKNNKVTKPYYKENPKICFIDDGTIDGTPSQITANLDKDNGLRFNWITDPKVTDTIIQYREKGKNDWTKAAGTGYVSYITKGYKEKYSHKVEISNLKPDTIYEYQVGDGKDFMSDIKQIKSSKSNNDSFSFLATTDPQSVSERDYQSFKNSLEMGFKKFPEADFFVNLGDIVQDGGKLTEWDACFNVMGNYFESYPSLNIIGGHESKGDKNLNYYRARFNELNTPELTKTVYDDTIGYVEYGNSVIVSLAIDTANIKTENMVPMVEAQLKWVKNIFESSNKKWRILLAHASPYAGYRDGAELQDVALDAIDDMKIDLYLAGHDHMYIRSSMKNNQKMDLNNGTTYVTCGTVGNKFNPILVDISKFADRYYNDNDLQTIVNVKVSNESIKVESIRNSEAKDWTKYEVSDEFEITKSLSADNGWKQVGNKWVYMKSGVKLTGWYNDIPGWENQWFYFNDEGYMCTAWQKIDTKWYYFDCNSGVMITGWVNDSLDVTNERWFYCDEVLGQMKTGWITNIPGWNNCWFYFLNDGNMAVGSVMINGMINYFNPQGVWVM